MNKERLDQLLVQKGLFDSRNKAQAAILAGIIFVDGKKEDKAGIKIASDAEIEIKGNPCPYVSRGGLKLEAALEEFKVDPTGKTCLDIGSSTGGFTDCLLQHGASKVFAVDVGYGIIDWKLRKDPRVVLIERTNARNLTLDDLKNKMPNACLLRWSPKTHPESFGPDRQAEFRMPNLATIDVSFISLTKILPAVQKVLAPEALVIALIKPQFEAGREQVGKGGILRDPEIHRKVIEKIKTEAEKLGFQIEGIIDSPITGTDGNKEFLICLIN
jgi:23S rRNA (cytidine1920-2'-O)/16S rRNA (cytidine1409-2'-O)-methyltransferase